MAPKKITKTQIQDNFGLSASIRKRIDELVVLQLTPSTINLLTQEFSGMDDELKERIGKYIAHLLEIENENLRLHFEYLNETNAFGNSRQEFIMKQKQTNLLRIQQIFTPRGPQSHHQSLARAEASAKEKFNIFQDLKSAMLTNQADSAKNVEREMYSKLANEKRKMELLDFEEENHQRLQSKKPSGQHTAFDSLAKQKQLEKVKKIEQLITGFKENPQPTKVDWSFLEEPKINPNADDEQKLRSMMQQNDKSFYDQIQKDLMDLKNHNPNYDLEVEEEDDDFDFISAAIPDEKPIPKIASPKKVAAKKEVKKAAKPAIKKSEVVSSPVIDKKAAKEAAELQKLLKKLEDEKLKLEKEKNETKELLKKQQAETKLLLDQQKRETEELLKQERAKNVSELAKHKELSTQQMLEQQKQAEEKIKLVEQLLEQERQKAKVELEAEKAKTKQDIAQIMSDIDNQKRNLENNNRATTDEKEKILRLQEELAIQKDKLVQQQQSLKSKEEEFKLSQKRIQDDKNQIAKERAKLLKQQQTHDNISDKRKSANTAMEILNKKIKANSLRQNLLSKKSDFDQQQQNGKPTMAKKLNKVVNSANTVKEKIKATSLMKKLTMKMKAHDVEADLKHRYQDKKLNDLAKHNKYVGKYAKLILVNKEHANLGIENLIQKQQATMIKQELLVKEHAQLGIENLIQKQQANTLVKKIEAQASDNKKQKEAQAKKEAEKIAKEKSDKKKAELKKFEKDKVKKEQEKKLEQAKQKLKEEAKAKAAKKTSKEKEIADKLIAQAMSDPKNAISDDLGMLPDLKEPESSDKKPYSIVEEQIKLKRNKKSQPKDGKLYLYDKKMYLTDEQKSEVNNTNKKIAEREDRIRILEKKLKVKTITQEEMMELETLKHIV